MAELNSASLDYTAQDIQVLEGMEAVRLRPGMYIGSTNEDGIHHLVNEILDNSIALLKEVGIDTPISFTFVKLSTFNMGPIIFS